MVSMVRDGQRVWPVCPKCGCRLEIFENNMFITLRHFWGGLEKDARGCICSRINSEWNITKKDISHLGYC